MDMVSGRFRMTGNKNKLVVRAIGAVIEIDVTDFSEGITIRAYRRTEYNSAPEPKAIGHIYLSRELLYGEE